MAILSENDETEAGIKPDDARYSDREKKQSIELFTGMKGSGKSALLKMEKLKEHKKVIIIDPRREYAGSNAVECFTLKDIAKNVKKKKIYRLTCPDVNIFDDIAAFVYDMGDLTLVMEEAPAYIPASNERLEPALENIIYRGRHHRINVLAAAQRASMININLRSQADKICIFRQRERADLKTCCDISGLEPEDILNLGIGDYYEVTFDGVLKKEVKKLKMLLTKT